MKDVFIFFIDWFNCVCCMENIDLSIVYIRLIIDYEFIDLMLNNKFVV